MSEQNVVEVIVVPEVPKVISDEEIYVYVPVATNNTKGIASFDERSINVVAGVASVNDSYVNELIDIKVQPINDGKLDKLTTDGSYVYAHTGNVQEEIAVSTDVRAGNIVKRLEDGGILVPDNTENEHSAINLVKVNSIVTPISETLEELEEQTEVKFTELEEQTEVKFTELDSLVEEMNLHIGHDLAKELNIIANEEEYKYTFSLKALDGSILSSYVIDLPLESVVVNGSYDEVNKSIVLTLKNGNEVIIPIENIIDGLATKSQLTAEATARQTEDNRIIALVTAEAAARQQADEELKKNIDDVPFFVGTDGYIYGKD